MHGTFFVHLVSCLQLVQYISRSLQVDYDNPTAVESLVGAEITVSKTLILSPYKYKF